MGVTRTSCSVQEMLFIRCTVRFYFLCGLLNTQYFQSTELARERSKNKEMVAGNAGKERRAGAGGLGAGFGEMGPSF